MTLKPEQLKSLEVVLAGSHVIAVLPTGVLFQSPGFFLTFLSFGETNLCTMSSTMHTLATHVKLQARACSRDHAPVPVVLGQGSTMIYVCKAES